MKAKHKHYLIIDFEATCCDQGSVPRSEMEIIEIGAVMLSTEKLTIESEFQTFVKPVRNPVLSLFCKELTSITQDEVDTAPLFDDALKKMKNWMNQYTDLIFCSWGDYDRNQLKQDCEFHDISYPFSDEHINLKKIFSETMGIKKRKGVVGALRSLGLFFEGNHHRGIDDARNIARIVVATIKREK